MGKTLRTERHVAVVGVSMADRTLGSGLVGKVDGTMETLHDLLPPGAATRAETLTPPIASKRFWQMRYGRQFRKARTAAAVLAHVRTLAVPAIPTVSSQKVAP